MGTRIGFRPNVGSETWVRAYNFENYDGDHARDPLQSDGPGQGGGARGGGAAREGDWVHEGARSRGSLAATRRSRHAPTAAACGGELRLQRRRGAARRGLARGRGVVFLEQAAAVALPRGQPRRGMPATPMD